eukprot:Rhum_TRINITY_DN15263_c1_g4::Rhum_TRINITY_DN15263_c1_g4_i1::g.147065::m.147065
MRQFYVAYDALPEADMVVCTDGSVQKNGDPPTTINGRSGAVWQAGDGEICFSKVEQAGFYASSFSAEYRAMEMGLRQISTSTGLPEGPVHLLTDSQSALKAVQRGPNKQTCVAGTKVWDHLHTLKRRGCDDVTLHYVPAHAGHPGNEAADEMACYPKSERGKRKDAIAQRKVPVPLASARAAIRAHHRGKRAAILAKAEHPKPSRRRRQDVYWKLTAGVAPQPQHRTLFRRGERLWHRLRTGYGPLGWAFGSVGYPRKIADTYECPACGADGMSLLHVLTSCSHAETRLEAGRRGLRFQCRNVMQQRTKAARRLMRYHPERVLQLLCRSGWLDDNENLLIRPDAAARNRKTNAAARAVDSLLSEWAAGFALEEEIMWEHIAERQQVSLEKAKAATARREAAEKQAAKQLAPPPLSKMRKHRQEVARKLDKAEAAERQREEARRVQVVEDCRKAWAFVPATPLPPTSTSPVDETTRVWLQGQKDASGSLVDSWRLEAWDLWANREATAPEVPEEM